MLGFEFAPRIADLADKRMYVPGKPGERPNLGPLIGGPLNIKLMEQQFDEVMRLTASIKQGGDRPESDAGRRSRLSSRGETRWTPLHAEGIATLGRSGGHRRMG